MKNKIVVFLILTVLFIQTTVSAQNIVYIEKTEFQNMQDGTDIIKDGTWKFIGSASEVSKNAVTENDETYIRLYSNSLKNGMPGGSYRLSKSDYEIMGDGTIEFDIRMKQGNMIFTLGEGVISSDPSYVAVQLGFNADQKQITHNGKPFAQIFEPDTWYHVSLRFNSYQRSYRIDVSDKQGMVSVSAQEQQFIENSPVRYVSTILFSNADKNPFESHIKDMYYSNDAVNLKDNATTQLSKDGVIQNTYPVSEQETQKLIDAKPFMPRQMEYLDRGTVAVKRSDDVYISWRWLGTEDISTVYNLYRDGIKLNRAPITDTTNYVDKDGTLASVYMVKAVYDGIEQNEGKIVGVYPANYISIPLNRPTGMPEGIQYASDDGMVGDLDHDGEYEIIVKRYPNDMLSHDYYPLLQAYKLDGTLMWTMNMGPNETWSVENPVMVYDLDGDGISEVILRIGDNFTDGTGSCLGDLDGDGITNYRDSLYDGHMFQKGPEYMAVFNGRTGAYIDSVPYAGSLSRDPLEQWATAGRITHRPWKFFFSPARLNADGMGFIAARGTYGKIGMQGFQLTEGRLRMLWEFNSQDYIGYDGQGNHNLSTADVDYDGYDEIIYGAMAVDHDGSPLYTTRLGHGDAMHVGDFDPNRPGLEVMQVHENAYANVNTEFRDARTGELIWGIPAGKDVGRGIADDFDPRYVGAESSANTMSYDIYGNRIDTKAIPNYAVYWDGDLLREFNDGITVSKYMAYSDQLIPLIRMDGMRSNNGSKANCTIQADILGDWREEVILPSSDDSELRIYISDAPTNHKLYTLMHDAVYRIGVAWQNNCYNQPPHLGFYFGYHMNHIPVPELYTVHNGVREESPAFQGKNKYAADTVYDKSAAIAADGFQTALINDYPHITYDGETVKAEPGSIAYEMIRYYDNVISSNGMVDYVTIPSAVYQLLPETRVIADEPFIITDINGSDVRYVDNGIEFNQAAGKLKNNGAGQIIKITTESGQPQLLYLSGKKEDNTNLWINDTLDHNPIASGSDFLTSKMNINGWKQTGESDNWKIITSADAEKIPKKRLVVLKNDSRNEKPVYFYLTPHKKQTQGKVTVSFDIQMRPSDSGVSNGEFMLNTENSPQSRAAFVIRQKGTDLYAGTEGEYVLLKKTLPLSVSGNGGICTVTAVLDFQSKTYDVLLMQNENVISSLYGMHFFDAAADSIGCFSVKAEPDSEIGVDDIKIAYQNDFSGVETELLDENGNRTADMQNAVMVKSVSLFKNTQTEGINQIISAVYDEGGRLTSVTVFPVDKSRDECRLIFETNQQIIKHGSHKLFFWDSLNGMIPIPTR